MFRRPAVRYGKTPEPETPYQRAGQVWDERIGVKSLSSATPFRVQYRPLGA
jgi:type IV secretory pathway TrbF-like protein